VARLARRADEEHRAQRLRFEIFNLELGEGLAASHAIGLDVDPFDEFCDHLIVEKVTTGEIIYALDHGSVADEVCYWRDMTLVPHLLNLFFKREIRSTCVFSAQKIRSGGRKQIAHELA
jgi:hypothetical protein